MHYFLCSCPAVYLGVHCLNPRVCSGSSCTLLCGSPGWISLSAQGPVDHCFVDRLPVIVLPVHWKHQAALGPAWHCCLQPTLSCSHLLIADWIAALHWIQLWTDVLGPLVCTGCSLISRARFDSWLVASCPTWGLDPLHPHL